MDTAFERRALVTGILDTIWWSCCRVSVLVERVRTDDGAELPSFIASPCCQMTLRVKVRPESFVPGIGAE